MKRIVYHDKDPDGWMSAAIILKKYPNTQTQGVPRSSIDFNLATGYDEVYVVDVSLEKEENLIFLKENNKKLIWIDHHKSAIETYSKNYEGIRNTTKAACILTWEYLFPNTPIPKAVAHVGDRDMWYNELEKTTEFSLFLESLPFGEEINKYLSLIEKEELSKEYEKGEVLKSFTNNLLKQMQETGIKQDFLGYKAMLFHGSILRSDLANHVLEENPDIQLSVVKHATKIINGTKEYNYSLRSRKGSDVDVGELSRLNGGGGHKHAAGFNSTKDL